MFMAETAKILSPDKTVLLPAQDASCPMALMASAKEVRKLRKENPSAIVVTYVNSTAEVKAVSDICCTSSNALKIVKNSTEKDIIFVPDKNLGDYIQKQVPEKNIILWPGFCPTHEKIATEFLNDAKSKYPKAKILTHPECNPELVDMSDFVGSTSQIIDYTKSDNSAQYIICTEEGVLHQMKKNNPKKEYHIVADNVLCKNMKITTLNKIYDALKNNIYEVTVDKDIAKKASISINRMLSS
jgi:quinolinate synthase